MIPEIALLIHLLHISSWLVTYIFKITPANQLIRLGLEVPSEWLVRMYLKDNAFNDVCLTSLYTFCEMINTFSSGFHWCHMAAHKKLYKLGVMRLIKKKKEDLLLKGLLEFARWLSGGGETLYLSPLVFLVDGQKCLCPCQRYQQTCDKKQFWEHLKYK